MFSFLILFLALPPTPGYEAKTLLAPRYDQLDVVGPGLIATCTSQTHAYLARCQGAPVRLIDLAGRSVGPKEPVVLEYRTTRVLVYSAPALPVAGQPPNPNAPRRWGLMTTDGKLTLPPSWRRIQFLGSRSLAYTTQVPCPAPTAAASPPTPVTCQKMGIIDLDRRGALPPFYETVVPDNEAPYAVQVGRGRWGYVDDAGRELVSPRFEVTARCVDGLCRAVSGSRTVFFDRAGRQTMVNTIHPIGDFSEGLASFQMPDGRQGYLDRTGKLAIPARYSSAGDFHNGLAAVMVGLKGGYIDRQGKLVTPLKWTEVEDFSDGIGRTVLESTTPDGRRVTETALHDRQGRCVFRGDGRISHYLASGFVTLYDPDRLLYGVVDPQTTRIVAPLVYRRVYISDTGLVAAVDPQGRTALLDRTGKTLLAPGERTITFNAAGVIVTTPGTAPSSVLLAPDGRRTLSAHPYDQLAGWDRVPHLGIFRRGATGGLIDTRGRERCTVAGASDGEFVTNGTPVLELRYYSNHSTGHFRHDFAADGLVKFRVAGKWGLYDLDCREVSPPVWEELAMMREWMIPAKSGGRWGLLKVTRRPAP